MGVDVALSVFIGWKELENSVIYCNVRGELQLGQAQCRASPGTEVRVAFIVDLQWDSMPWLLSDCR